MFRHSVDTKTEYSAYRYKTLPESCTIETSDEEESMLKESSTKISVSKEVYLPGSALVEAVNVAIALGRPLLLQGDPGCGKTRLSYAVAYALKLPLEVCYVKSTSHAQDLLYTYDAVNRLYDAEMKDERCKDIRNYIRLGPLGRAIKRAQNGRRSVVLIDEIDKADIDFPNDLLWELDRLEFSVAEAPEIHYAVGDKPQLRPIVLITHNEEKALPIAFLRRCIFHFLAFPQNESTLQEILDIHRVGDQELGRRAIRVVLRLRELDLSKKPGLSELIDWVGYMQAVRTPIEELDKLPYAGVLLKQQSDQQLARKEFQIKEPHQE